MNDGPELYDVKPQNLHIVLKTLIEGSFEINPTDHVPMEEIIGDFKTAFPLRAGGYHSFTTTDLTAFLDSIGKKAMERALAFLVKEDIVEMSHDGTDFCFKLKDEHK
jgi:hypothetical protein